MNRSALVLLSSLAVAACGSPLPTSQPSTAPALTASPSSSAAAPGEIRLTCDDPYPGHCLQEVAFAVDHLPAGHGPIVAITAASMAHPCDGYPRGTGCTQPPHHDDLWVSFAMRDGGSFGMWIADQMGMRTVELADTDPTPPAAVGSAAISYPLLCGAIAIETCSAAAAGAVVTNSTPTAVMVVPGPVTPYRVTFSFADGSKSSVDVVRDPTWGAWSPASPVPTPSG